MPWLPSEAARNRVPPRECVAAARKALDKTYGLGQGVAAIPLLIEAVDWLRRALEQMNEGNAK
jgi:hypothetical protein